MAEIYKVDQTARKFLFEGVQGENEARSIQFDITPWTTELGNGAVTATAKRPTDAAPYPVAVTRDGNTVTWKPTSTDTAIDGAGMFQLEYTVDDVLAKTCIWSTMVAPSLDPAGDPPDPYDNWLAEMREIAADAIQAAQDADESADDAQAEVYEAEAWAKGTKNGTPVSSSDAQYQNNSKYFAEESYKNAEAWAVGQRGGVDVPSTDPTYENNAKYWAGKSEELKDDTQAIVDEARADVFEAMDGLHEDLTAGNAEQLLSTVQVEDQAPYLFRTSGGSTDIGNREIDKIVGGTVAWNQLVPIASTSKTVTQNNVTITDNRDGSYTVQTTEEGASAETSITLTGAVTNRGGHVGLIKGCPAGGYESGVTKYRLWDAWGGLGNDYGSGKIGKWVAGGQFEIRITIGNGIVITDPIKFVPQVIDLTQMFGSTIANYIYSLEQAEAGAGVAFFRKLFPKPYYEYNAGELMSVKTTAHETVGFNAFDVSNADLQQKAWENIYTVSQNVHTEGYTKVIGGQNYCFHQNIETQGRYIRFYDADYNFLESESLSTHNNNDYVFTVPADAMYLRLMWYDANGVSVAEVANGDICINLSWSGWRNGEYEPYVKHSYPLDSSLELRGIPKLDASNNLYYDGDTYESDGTVTRKYGIVDLGTLTYSSAGANILFYTSGVKTLIRKASGNAEVLDWVVCSSSFKYVSYNAIGTSRSYEMCMSTSGNILLTLDTGRTYTPAEVAAALSGVYLVYELATPTTETADPYTNPQIVNDFGTEEYVDYAVSQGDRDVAIPVGHVTKYPDNLREKLDGLPWDFSSLIAPTEKAYTATRNYTAGSLLIVNNVLYKATANIANGGAITPNTNVVATTLSEVISAL